MPDTFVIRNQLGHYYSKGKEWTDGREAQTVAQFKYRDEALNTLVELSSKDVELRAEIFEPELTDSGKLKLEVSQHPLPGDTQESISVAI